MTYRSVRLKWWLLIAVLLLLVVCSYIVWAETEIEPQNKEWNYYDEYVEQLKSDKWIDDFERNYDIFKESVIYSYRDKRVLDLTTLLTRAEYLYYKQSGRLHTPAELSNEYSEIIEAYLGCEYIGMELIAFRYRSDDLYGYPEYYEEDFVYLIAVFPERDRYAMCKAGGLDRKDLPKCSWYVDDKIRYGIYSIEHLLVFPPAASNRNGDNNEKQGLSNEM